MKRILALCLTIFMLLGLYPVALAQLEYEAEFSILGTAVDFENKPYSDGQMVFVPLEELCSYLNLPVTKDGDYYTVVRNKKNAVIRTENMVCTLNGAEMVLSAHPSYKNGVLYVPGDFFEICLGMSASESSDGRSMDLTPNVYSIDIDENHAAAISGASPDADILAIGETANDLLFEPGAKYDAALQKSVYYLIDLADVSTLDISEVNLGLYIGKGGNNNPPSINVVRTAVWEKGSISYNNKPTEYTSENTSSISLGSDYATNMKSFKYNSFDITSLVENALKEGSKLSVKVQAFPYSGLSSAPKTTQAGLRGVNTQYAPKVYVSTEESFTFPVKKNDLKMSDASDYDDIKLLASLGIVTTEDEFPMNLTEAKISRGDFVKFAARLKNNHRANGSDAQHFSDVPTDNEYFKAVAGAYSEGIVTGEQGSLFRPYDAITVNEACAVIGRILGYDEYALRNGGYAQGYIKAATRVSLLSGAKNENGVLTYQGVARMLVNALDAPMFVPNVFNSIGTVEYIFDEGTTVLTEYFDATQIKGTVTANEYSYISGALAGSNHIAIDGKKLSLRYEAYKDFLGYEVKAYYNNDNELLYMGIKEGSVDTVDLSQVVSVSGENGITIRYEADGDTKSISFLKSDVIYNGKVVPSNSVRADMFDVDGGEIVKLSSGRVIARAYTDMIAYGIDTEEEVISDKYSPYDKALRLKNTDYYTITDTNGHEIKLEDIKTGSVLSVAKSLDGKIAYIIASEKKITGTVQSVTDSGNETVLEVAGLSYKTANRHKNWTDKLGAGKSGTFYIDAFGKICDFESGEKENTVGYLIAMDYAGGGISKKLQAAIMVGTSEKYVLYNLADRVKVNGTPEKDHSVIRGIFYPEGSFVQQAILFSTNSEGKINKINTAVDATGTPTAETLASITDETLVKSYNLNNDYYRNTTGKLADWFYWDILKNPAVMIPADSTKLDDFETVSGSVYTYSNALAGTVYTLGYDTPVAELVVLNEGTLKRPSTGLFGVVQKKAMKLNEDGEYINTLHIQTAPEKIEIIAVPDESVSAISGFEFGDIVLVTKDYKDELSSAIEYYDYDNHTIMNNAGFAHSYVSSSARYFGGYAIGKKDGYVKLAENAENVESKTRNDFVWIDVASVGNLYRYTADGKYIDMQKATADDILDYNTVPYAPSGLFVYTYKTAMKTAFILELDQPAGTGIYKAEFNGGEGITGSAPAFKRVNIGETITIPDSGSMMKNEYRFIGWKLGDRVYAPGESYTITSESTVFNAEWEWEGQQYMITFTGGSGASGEEFTKTTSDAYPALTMPTTDDGGVPRFTKPGHVYRVWTDGVNDYTPGETYSITSQITITPKWIECWDGTASDAAPQTTVIDGKTFYQISNGNELAWFSNEVDKTGGDGNVNAILTKDIRLNLDGETINGWQNFQIGNVNAFAGIFDGNGKKIINYYYESDATYSGMFYKIDGGSVKNLTFENAKFVSTAAATTSTYSAIVCGYAIDATFDSITVSGSAYAAEGKYMNCFGTITGFSVKGTSYVLINNCVNNMSIDASAATTALESTNNSGLGGIAGCVRSGTKITNCTNNGTINAPKTSRVGGVVGNIRSADGGTAVDNCTNTADITGYSAVGQIYGYSNNVTPTSCTESTSATVTTTK